MIKIASQLLNLQLVSFGKLIGYVSNGMDNRLAWAMLGGTLQGKPNDSVRYGRNDVLALGSYLTVYLKTYRFSNFPFQGTLRQDRREIISIIYYYYDYLNWIFKYYCFS